ncbi:MAG: NAD(P)H-dependent oxidoreductase [Spirochaetaceae bacterium]
MNDLIYIGASNSKKSINREFAKYTANKITGLNTTELNLNDYEVAIYSVDREEEGGIPEKIKNFMQKIDESNGLVISLAEHNGNYTVAFKNILDWASRADRNVWKNKPIFLLSTSPGSSGGGNVLNLAKASFPHMNGIVEATFKLPSFYDNFSNEIGIKDNLLEKIFQKEFDKFRSVLEAQL